MPKLCCVYAVLHGLRRPIHVRVWLRLISPHTYECGDPHTDEFGSLEPEPSRVELASQTRTCMGPLRHELSSLALTLGSCVRILLEA
jgi:hypothetical protein